MAARPDGLSKADVINAKVLAAELDWLDARIDARIGHHLGTAAPGSASPEAIEPPELRKASGPYAAFVERHGLDPDARLLVALCLAPALRPQALDILFTVNESMGRGFTEFGGHTIPGHGGFLPTGETAAFLLCGDDLARRSFWRGQMCGQHPLVVSGALRLDPPPAGAPLLSGPLELRPQLIDELTQGRTQPPRFGPGFPAHPLVTEETWDDLVLPGEVLSQVGEIRAWLEHGPTLLAEWGFARRMRPGFRSLFHGPPGTGKTMTAALLGKVAGRAVYRVDLSMVVSKYIGETEKNLARVFEVAEGRDWILFFDEADALFGRRTQVRDARDRFANQQISYLLQRIEHFAGVVLLASNLKEHIDAAFTRRFHSVIYFPLPDRMQRRLMWQKALATPVRTDSALDVQSLVPYEMSGAAIVNAVRAAALAALSHGEGCIDEALLLASIRREILKDGRSL